jgi:hypothetical protein
VHIAGLKLPAKKYKKMIKKRIKMKGEEDKNESRIKTKGG